MATPRGERDGEERVNEFTWSWFISLYYDTNVICEQRYEASWAGSNGGMRFGTEGDEDIWLTAETRLSSSAEDANPKSAISTSFPDGLAQDKYRRKT